MASNNVPNYIHGIEKLRGETPLEALNRFRKEHLEFGPQTPMTYAGRLDPLASGTLLILVGPECKNKEKYLGLDKEYVVDILCGVSTDSYDTLGLPTLAAVNSSQLKSLDWQKYVGKFIQEYPPYSSKTVNGKQLHVYVRGGELPEEMPTKEVEIYSLKVLKEYSLSAKELLTQVINDVARVHGDFRQEEIVAAWKKILDGKNSVQFPCVQIQVKCSSGTYMRSLAHRVGVDLGGGACALSIHRTKLFTP